VPILDDPHYLFGADLRKAQFPTATYSIAYSARFYTANLGEPWVFLGTVIHDTRLPKAQNDRFLAPKTFFLRVSQRKRARFGVCGDQQLEPSPYALLLRTLRPFPANISIESKVFKELQWLTQWPFSFALNH
jgi:hypothetical protein